MARTFYISVEERGTVTNGDMIKAMFPKLEWVEGQGDTKSYLLEPDNMLSPKLGAFNSW